MLKVFVIGLAFRFSRSGAGEIVSEPSKLHSGTWVMEPDRTVATYESFKIVMQSCTQNSHIGFF